MVQSPGEAVASALAALATRLGPDEAARACGAAARDLADALKAERGVDARSALPSALATLAPRLGPDDAAAAASAVAAALKAETGVDARSALAEALAALATRLGPDDATAAASAVADALKAETGVYEQSALASALATLATRLDPDKAAQTYDDAAQDLAAALRSGTNASARYALEALAPRLEADKAARVANEVVHDFFQSWNEQAPGPYQPKNHRGDAVFPTSLLPFLRGEKARRITRLVVFRSAAEASFDGVELLSDASTPETFRRSLASSLCAAFDPTAAGLANAAAIQAWPYPCRLGTDDLVELLKMPTLFGDARRVVLDHLGGIHGQTFANHWEFVAFARRTGLKVDLTTPPVRPDPRIDVDAIFPPGEADDAGR